MQGPLFSPPYKNLNMETVIGNCLDNLKWFIPGLCTAPQIKAEETWIIESFCTETNPSPFFLLTHTLAQIRMLRKTKRKRGKDVSEEAASLEFSGSDFFVWSYCTWHHVACDFTPTSKLSHVNKECAVTQSHFCKITSQETKLFRDHLSFFLNSSPLSLSFLPSFLPPFPSSPLHNDQLHSSLGEQHLSI